MIDMHIYSMKDGRQMAVFCWTYGSKEYIFNHIYTNEADAVNWMKLTLRRQLAEFLCRYVNQRTLAYGNAINAEQSKALAWLKEWFCTHKTNHYTATQLLELLGKGWYNMIALAPGPDSRYQGITEALNDIKKLVPQPKTQIQS